MKKREPVSSIMSHEVVTVERNVNSLRDVKDLFRKHKIRHVPVLEGEKLVGMISKNDIMRLSFANVFEGQESSDEAILDMLSIDQVMSAQPKWVDKSASVKEAAEILVREHFNSLPVRDGEELVGIVTSTDVMKYLLDQF